MSKKQKKKKTTPGKKQSISFEPLIAGKIPEGQSNDILDKQMQEIERIFNSLTIGKHNMNC